MENEQETHTEGSADTKLRKYEAVIILHPDSTEEEQKSILRKNVDYIKKCSGELHHLDSWGKRKLSNPVKKINRGVYFHMTFQTEGRALKELERILRINDRVLRFCHTRIDDRITLPKFMESFRESLAEGIAREREREARVQQKKAAFAAARKMQKN